MKILDRYIAKQIIAMILIVAVALLGFDLFFTLVHELKVVGKGQYTLASALAFIAFTIPTRLYTMFPWSALIGALISLGALANHSELVVMRTAGVSVLRMTGFVLKAALILAVVAVFLGEGIAPVAERLAQNNRTLALSGGQTIETAFGLWVRQGQEFIHIRAVRANGELLGVTRYQFDSNRQLKEAIYAESAVPEGKGWRLNKVQGTQFTPKKTKAFRDETQFVANLLEVEILETATIKHPERLSLRALYRTIQHRLKNDLNAQTYELAFWTKILQPLVILMMVFLAVPFIFGPLRTVSMGFRIVVGICVAFLFHTLNNLFVPLAVVYQFPPFIAVLCPIIVFSGFGIWLLKRVK